jgi:Cdc6-like AAA superfamily ATPase
VSSLIQKISKQSKRPVILMIDEIQHLATASEFWPIASALRTVLDRMNGEVKSIFTGSSKSHMQFLTKNKESQFYNFSSEVDFPLIVT